MPLAHMRRLLVIVLAMCCSRDIVSELSHCHRKSACINAQLADMACITAVAESEMMSVDKPGKPNFNELG